MSTRLSTDRAAVVDGTYYWREIATDPPPGGAKVQLINRQAGIAQYGSYTASNDWYTHWAPLPVFRRELACPPCNHHCRQGRDCPAVKEAA